VVSFMPQPLYPRERAPDTHWIGGWVEKLNQSISITQLLAL